MSISMSECERKTDRIPAREILNMFYAAAIVIVYLLIITPEGGIT